MGGAWLSTIPIHVNGGYLILAVTWMIHQDISFQVCSAASIGPCNQVQKNSTVFFYLSYHIFLLMKYIRLNRENVKLQGKVICIRIYTVNYNVLVIFIRPDHKDLTVPKNGKRTKISYLMY